jgi:hypothetical protein
MASAESLQEHCYQDQGRVETLVKNIYVSVIPQWPSFRLVRLYKLDNQVTATITVPGTQYDQKDIARDRIAEERDTRKS